MQVNPHIGIFSEDAGAPTSPAGRLQQRIISNVRARLFKYTIEKALPHEMQVLVSQDYTGRERDITMFPAFTVGDLSWRILAHPRACDMEHFLLGGRRMVWPKLTRIRFQTRIERLLEQCSQDIGLHHLHEFISRRPLYASKHHVATINASSSPIASPASDGSLDDDNENEPRLRATAAAARTGTARDRSTPTEHADGGSEAQGLTRRTSARLSTRR